MEQWKKQGMKQCTQMPEEKACIYMDVCAWATSGYTGKRLATVFNGRMGERRGWTFYFILFCTL